MGAATISGAPFVNVFKACQNQRGTLLTATTTRVPACPPAHTHARVLQKHVACFHKTRGHAEPRSVPVCAQRVLAVSIA